METLSILLIEHDRQDVKKIEKTLTRAGLEFNLRVEKDCTSGLAVLKEKNTFDCVLVDYDLPMGDGLRFVRQARELEFRMPIIVVNSDEQEQLIIDMTRAGASNYVFKGFLTSLSLTQVLNNALRIHELEKASENTLFQLKETQARFHAIIHNAPDAIITIDDEFRIIDWNPQAEVIFGFKEADMMDKIALNKLFSNGYPQVLTSELKKYIEKGKSSLFNQKLEVDACHEEGKEFPVELTIVPSKLDRKNIFIFFIRDITHAKKQEETISATAQDLKRSNSELEQFAYVASHDLQEPLRMINSYMTLIKERYGEKLDGDGDEFLRFAVEGAKRMKILIDDLLQFSRVNPGRIKFESVNLNEVVRTVERDLSMIIKDENATIEYEDLPTVKADKSQMHRLFQNLLSNAIKFKKEEVAPVVKVSAKKLDGHFEITVGDNGIGMDARDFDRIFVIFQRLHTRENYQGTGIGLAICKKIVELHGGEIKVESVVGDGTRFIFTLKEKPVLVEHATK